MIGPEQGEQPALPDIKYETVDDFFQSYVRMVYRRRVDARGGSLRRWSKCWWKYPEAYARMEAIWASWEHARVEPPPALAMWWRDVFDPMMAELTSPDGPFWCAPKEDLVTNEDGEPWDVPPMSEDMQNDRW